MVFSVPQALNALTVTEYSVNEVRAGQILSFCPSSSTLNNFSYICAHILIRGQNSAKFGWIIKGRSGKMKSRLRAERARSSQSTEPNDLAY